MNLALAFKAEVVLGIQLITRHRAPRLILVLAASLMLVLVTGDPGEPGPLVRQRTILLIAASLGAVAGSRLLARGGPLAAARRVATSALVPVAGRAVGSVLLIGPLLLAISTAVIGGGARLAETVAVALVLSAVMGAVTMALTPAVGASSAAGLGFLAALFGGARPSAVAAMLEGWPLLRTPAVLLWNALPFPWRASRWLADGPGRGDPWLLLGWLVLALGVAALAVERFPEANRPEASS